MSIKKGYGFIALEEHDEAVDTTLMEVPSETIEAEMVEIEGQDRDIETLVAEGEELEHDQEQVEALADNAEASLEEGDGMDETAARATEIATESFCAKWGIRRQKIGLESFSDSSSRRRATQVAVEDLRTMASDLWNTFIKWLKELVAKGKDLLLKLTNAGKTLKKRADKLEARLDKGLGAIDKKEVEGGFVKLLVVDEKPNYEECLKFAADSATNIQAMAVKVKTTIDEAGAVVRKGTVDPSTKELTPGDKFGKKISKKMNVPQGATNVAISALPGNGYLISYTDRNDVAVVRYESANDKVKDGKMPTLAADKIASGIKALYTIGDVLETKLKGFRDVNDAIDKLADAASDAQKKLKDAKGDERDAAKKVLANARAAVNNAKYLERAAVSSLKNAGMGIQGYLSASISAYKAA